MSSPSWVSPNAPLDLSVLLLMFHLHIKRMKVVHMVREDYVMLQSRMGKTVVKDCNTTKLTVTVYNNCFTHGDQDCNHLQLVAVFKVTLVSI